MYRDTQPHDTRWLLALAKSGRLWPYQFRLSLPVAEVDAALTRWADDNWTRHDIAGEEQGVVFECADPRGLVLLEPTGESITSVSVGGAGDVVFEQLLQEWVLDWLGDGPAAELLPHPDKLKELELTRTMFHAGRTDREIAQRISKSVPTVQRRLRELGLFRLKRD